MSVLETPRLRLVPITLSVVEAVMAGRRGDTEALVGATLPRLVGPVATSSSGPSPPRSNASAPTPPTASGATG
ncbi:MAG: hypothetical protein V9G19_27935 [Tetrasphaera sp.]